jgi:hypothetical protein
MDTATIDTQVELNPAQAKAAEILAKRGKKAPKTEGEAEVKVPKAPKAPKAPPAKVGYKFLRDMDEHDKLNNQQKILIDAMLRLRGTEGDSKDVVVRSQLISEVTPEMLKSRQSTEAVLGFYMNGWKKGKEATDKKPAIAPLLEVVKIAG